MSFSAGRIHLTPARAHPSADSTHLTGDHAHIRPDYTIGTLATMT